MAIRYPKRTGPRGVKYRRGAGGSSFENFVRIQIEHQGLFDTDKTKTRIPYKEEHTYIPDFVLPNGVIIEAKGYFPSEDRTKMKAVKECHPELDIRFVFQRAKTKLNKTSKISYADWAERHGFPWADKEIPLEWIYEKENTH